MPVSRSFLMGKRLGQLTRGLTDVGVIASGSAFETSITSVAASVVVYATVAELPLSGNEAGDQAFVSATNRLYIWNGSGWYNIALVNTSPSITSGADASYVLNSDGTPTVITLVAADPEGLPITWSYSVTSGSLQDTTVTNSGGAFTITPGSTAATFDLTFTASDGINTGTSASSFTLSFAWAKAATNYGYVVGGRNISPTTQVNTSIDRFPFSSDTITTGVGTLSTAVAQASGQSSSVGGYSSGGHNPTSPLYKNVIQKFTFSSEGTTSSVGTLSAARAQGVGQSSTTHGYHVGGFYNVPSNATRTNIYKFSFASEGTTTQSGVLASSVGERHMAATSTDDYGYSFGGLTALGGASDIVAKHPFSTDANTTNVGNLYTARVYSCGITTQDNGYLASGAAPGQTTNVEKWTYSSDTTAGIVGDLSVVMFNTTPGGVSGTDNGYIAGGHVAGQANRVEKFSFSSETASTPFGTLALNLEYPTTNQY